MGFVGLSGPPGGLGEYTTLKPANFHILPDDMGLDVGAMIEPLGKLVPRRQEGFADHRQQRSHGTRPGSVV